MIQKTMHIASHKSHMQQEAESSAGVVQYMLAQDEGLYTQWAEQMALQNPTQILTVARGSSDHAAHYFGYLTSLIMGKIVTSLPMSLVSVHQTKLDVDVAVALAISQSGESPDLLATMRALRSGGAYTAALINTIPSSLSSTVETAFNLHAGLERSVAATKSFIASLVCSARLVGAWQMAVNGETALLEALQALPQQLEAACKVTQEKSWSQALEVLTPADKALVLGRGLGLSVALEAALKLKETSNMQAEAFSGAEVVHGPMTIVGEGYPLVVFALAGAALERQLQLARELRARGAKVLVIGSSEHAEVNLPIPAASHKALHPILAIQAFYCMAAQLSAARGLDPDAPKYLSKVTKTA